MKSSSQNLFSGKNIFENNNTLDGYELLAIAIVNQAAEDYRKELKKSAEHGTKTSAAYAIERFFTSDYGYVLTFGLGEVILEKLQNEHRTKIKPYFSGVRQCKGRRKENDYK